MQRRQKTEEISNKIFSFNEKNKKKKKKKIKVRQKDKRKQQEPSFSKKKRKKKERNFAERETFFSSNKLTKWKEGETFLVGLFKKGVVKRNFVFPNFLFSFLVKNIWKRKNRWWKKKGEMKDWKRGRGRKTTNFRPFVFWTKKTRKQRRAICKTFFLFKKGVRGNEKQETKRKQQRQTTKKMKETTNQKTPK